MKRLSLALAVVVASLVPLRGEDKPTEQGVVAELKALASRPDPKKTADLDAEELKELMQKRGERALEMITKFEADHPKSKSLDDARLYALKAISRDDELATAKGPIALAKRLRAATKKGTDHAAQADLFLLGADVRATLRDSKSGEDFAKAWNKNADSFREKIKTYLEDHPKYKPAANAMRRLVPLLDLAGDTKTRDLIVESVAKNLPDHPLAKAGALRRAVGKEFDLKFTPVGKDKEESLKDLRGKVVVVNFWTSWCVPCKAEMRQLKELYEKHHKDGLEIVGFSLDEKEAGAKRFLKAQKPAWRQVIGKEAVAVGEKYGIETVPVQIVIDREGKLITVDALGKLPEVLAKLLEEKK